MKAQGAHLMRPNSPVNRPPKLNLYLAESSSEKVTFLAYLIVEAYVWKPLDADLGRTIRRDTNHIKFP
jgi:hypothetical protein